MNTKSLLTQSLHRLALAGIMAGLIGGTTTLAQSYNEDEWYDPTDWFDGNNIEADDTYDYSPYDYDYDYGFDDTYDYGTDWSAYDTWGDGYWGPDYYDSNYWNDYSWNDTTSDASNTSSMASNNGQKNNSSTASTSSSNNQNKSSSNKSDKTKTSDAEIYTFTIFALPVGDSQSASSKSSGSSNQSGSSKDKMKKSGQNQSVAKLNGTIEGLRQMKLKQSSGATGKYTLANIRLENGKNTIVNLGRSSQLKDLKLKKGDSIQAVGRRGQIVGKTVFVAQKLKSGGKTIDANPVIRLSDQQVAQQQNQKTIQGTVADVTQSTSRAKNNHTLLNVRLENGQSATVDLGPGVSLDKIDLQEGEKVTVRGHTKQMEGREVLVPNLMKVDGQKISSVSE